VPVPAVNMGALVMCSFGVAPAELIVEPVAMVMIEDKPAATIESMTPANIPTVGMCLSLANPEVATATAAALGVLTPMPCVPALTPWIPMSPLTLIGDVPVLVSGSTCICAFAGVVEILFPGAVQTLA
jgi:hypothetical protein